MLSVASSAAPSNRLARGMTSPQGSNPCKRLGSDLVKRLPLLLLAFGASTVAVGSGIGAGGRVDSCVSPSNALERTAVRFRALHVWPGW
jgi:hypothetical protein